MSKKITRGTLIVVSEYCLESGCKEVYVVYTPLTWKLLIVVNWIKATKNSYKLTNEYPRSIETYIAY